MSTTPQVRYVGISASVSGAQYNILPVDNPPKFSPTQYFDAGTFVDLNTICPEGASFQVHSQVGHQHIHGSVMQFSDQGSLVTARIHDSQGHFDDAASYALAN